MRVEFNRGCHSRDVVMGIDISRPPHISHKEWEYSLTEDIGTLSYWYHERQYEGSTRKLLMRDTCIPGDKHASLVVTSIRLCTYLIDAGIPVQSVTIPEPNTNSNVLLLEIGIDTVTVCSNPSYILPYHFRFTVTAGPKVVEYNASKIKTTVIYQPLKALVETLLKVRCSHCVYTDIGVNYCGLGRDMNAPLCNNLIHI
jgi:hypothetical protein